MNDNLSVDIGLLEGRTYIIGRDGHIYIDSPVVSQQHAEIKIINGRVYLRDLNSTNGTYLLRKNRLVFFTEGYVNLLQPIMIGDQKHTIQGLLAVAGDFVNSDEFPTQIQATDRHGKQLRFRE